MKIARVAVPQRHANLTVRPGNSGVLLAIGPEDIWLRTEVALKLADALVDAAENSRSK